MKGKSILIAPIGTEAQIVTTSLTLLGQQRETIDEVVVLHSCGDPQLETAAQRIREALSEMKGINFQVKPFCRKSHTIRALDSDEEIEILLFCLYDEVRRAKNAGKRVHLLCSGGRKLIAAYAMLTAQLLFDENDRLWYLISKGEFLESKALRPETPVDFTQTRLLRIPFLSWSAALPSISELGSVETPAEAFRRIESLRMREKYRKAEEFITTVCTPRQRDILSLAIQNGLSNAQIAQELVITERTVESHMAALLKKATDFWSDPALAQNRVALSALLQPYYQLEMREGTECPSEH